MLLQRQLSDCAERHTVLVGAVPHAQDAARGGGPQLAPGGGGYGRHDPCSVRLPLGEAVGVEAGAWSVATQAEACHHPVLMPHPQKACADILVSGLQQECHQ